MALNEVRVGDPHTAAHNEERAAINELTNSLQSFSSSVAPEVVPTKFTNLLGDPTFQLIGQAGRYWQYLGGSGVRTGNDFVFTGNGTITGIGIYSGLDISINAKRGHRYYVRAVMLIPLDSPSDANGFAVSLTDNTTHMYLNGISSANYKPTKGVKYVMSGIIEPPSDWDGKIIRLNMRAWFPDTTASNGGKVTISPPVIFDLTETAPNLPEPMIQWVDRAANSQTTPIYALTRPASEVAAKTLQMRSKRSVAAGPHVVFRFDDGFLNNLEVAAPIMARYGYRGTLYTTTKYPGLSGATTDNPLMTPDQIRTLWDTYNWEIGAHTQLHEDAVATETTAWRASADGCMQDIMSWGLPRPTSFAYPNGSRTAATDKIVYGLFDKCAVTGGPERLAWPYARGAFYNGWSALGGATEADGKNNLAKLKRYIAAAFDRGTIPIIGLHGVTHQQPTLAHFCRADLLSDLCQWLWANGYPVSTQNDVARHNKLADPGFMDNPFSTYLVGTHPWAVNNETGGWVKYASDSTAFGRVSARLNGSFAANNAQWIEQRFDVEPGKTYKVYIHSNTASVSSGSVRVRVYFADVLGTSTSDPSQLVTSITAAAPAGGEWLGGTFTAPSGAFVARINIQSDGGSGASGDFRVDSVACYPSDTYDPLA